MKLLARKNRVITLICFLTGLFSMNGAECQSTKQKFYIAIEFNKVVCGYSQIVIYDSLIDGKSLQILSQEVHTDFSALGRDLSQYQKFTYHIDPESGSFVYHDSYHKQEGMERGGSASVENEKVSFKSMDDDEEEIFEITDSTILPNTQFFKYLKEDFADKDVKQKGYHVWDVRTGKISEISYSKLGEEQLELAGKVYDTVVLTETDPATGVDTKIWIDTETGLRLRMESPTQLVMYLTDVSVKSNITTGNWDDVIFGKTNKYISKIQGISYMKVKVILDVIPNAMLTDLNVKGQKFSGEINGNRIDGLFEITHVPYTGQDSPSFPMDVAKFEDLHAWLEPSLFIESDDSVLLEAARNITEGSKTSWDAAYRISLWVIENIEGSLQSGTARETYDSRTGLCASQSMLMAALCRAAGIPSRVVRGCMYNHEQGGSFGSHGWNEVFMGDADWIPLDVTSHEGNYVDCGHIRLGVLNTTQTVTDYKTMEILEYSTSKLP